MLEHTGRCLALGKEFLAAGHEANFGAYGYSKDLVKKTGYSAYETHPEIRLIGETGTFDIGKSIKETLSNFSPTGFRKLLKLIEDLTPDVVRSTIGVFGYRATIFRNVLEATKLDRDIHHTFISGPGIDTKQFPETPDNVEFTGFTDNPFSY